MTAERPSRRPTEALQASDNRSRHVPAEVHGIAGFRAACRGIGEQILAGSEADARVLTTSFPEWGSPIIVTLEHGNLSRDYVQTRPEASQSDLVLSKWLVDLELELPGVLWRKRLIDARQQFQVEGRYDLAVILFVTATEVLIDGVLQMLWWEKSLTDPQITAATVAEAGTAPTSIDSRG